MAHPGTSSKPTGVEPAVSARLRSVAWRQAPLYSKPGQEQATSASVTSEDGWIVENSVVFMLMLLSVPQGVGHLQGWEGGAGNPRGISTQMPGR
jgi:hypothetical protein